MQAAQVSNIVAQMCFPSKTVAMWSEWEYMCKVWTCPCKKHHGERARPRWSTHKMYALDMTGKGSSSGPGGTAPDHTSSSEETGPSGGSPS